MRMISSPFRSNRVKLSLKDIIKLLLFCTIQEGALKIGLWRMPKDIRLSQCIKTRIKGAEEL